MGISALWGSLWRHLSAGSGRRCMIPLATLLCAATLASPAMASGGWVLGGKFAEAEVHDLSPAVSEAGEVLYVWMRSDGKNQRVEASARPPGGSLSAPVILSLAGASAESPGVAFDELGDAIVVWTRGSLIEYSYRPAGGAFEKPRLVSEVENAESPRVVFASNGEAVVLWTSRAGTIPNLTFHLEASSLPTGGHAFGLPQQVDSLGPVDLSKGMGEIFISHPVADGQGNVLASWERHEEHMGISETTLAESVEVASRPAGGAFGAPATLAKAAKESLIDERLEGVNVAIDAKGDALVTWSRFKLAEEVDQVEGSYRPSGGGFEPAPEIVSGSRKESREAQPAMAANGTATVVWVGIDLASQRHAVLAADRPPGGGFSEPQLVSDPSLETGSFGPQSPAVVIGPSGEVTTVWVRYQSPSRVEASVRPAGGIFGTQQPISAEGSSGAVQFPQIAVDGTGDAAATWMSSFAGEWAAHDVSGPALSGLSIPASASVGSAVAFAVSPLDAFSPLGVSSWSFGDGATGTGTSLTHVYSHPGKFTVGLSSLDLLGNGTAANGTITVVAASASTPNLTAVRESNKVWRRGAKLAHLTRRVPVGTTFSFVLDQAARVTLSFTQPAKGRRVGHGCVAPGAHNRHKPRCTRVLTRGSLSFAAHSGLNRISFQGQISKSRRLVPGRYTAVMVAANGTGSRSTPARLQLTIIR
jgi:PKD domain